MQRLCISSVPQGSCAGVLFMERLHISSVYISAGETYALGSLFNPMSNMGYVADSESMKQDNTLPTTLQY